MDFRVHVPPASAWLFTCEVVARVETGEVTAFGLAIRAYWRDGLGTEFIPMRYRVALKLRFEERWDRTEYLLQQLESIRGRA